MLGIQLDLFHTQRVEGNISKWLREYARHIFHVQIAGFPSRNEPDSLSEINYPFIFRVLEETGYDGWVAAEYQPRVTTLSGLEWFRPYVKSNI